MSQTHSEKSDGSEQYDDEAADGRPTCFVVMPYGTKHAFDAPLRIDFDHVYRELIKPAVEQAGYACTRSDTATEAGVIQQDMIERLVKADLVVVDITLGNPNVMYELGVRHAARRTGTLIIRRRDSLIPFNIGSMRALDYGVSISTPGENAQAGDVLRDPFSVEDVKALQKHVKAAGSQHGVDSMVHALVPGLNVVLPTTVLRNKKITDYRIPGLGADRLISIIEGDITNVTEIDVWVNGENTRMEMGRLHDHSISALIRYFGARRNARGHVVDDTIVRELRTRLGTLSRAPVEPGTVIVTGSGKLRHDNQVRCIFHVAAQHGEPAHGYTTMRGYTRCVHNVLYEMDEWNKRLKGRTEKPLSSVLFPLFGSRDSALNPNVLVADMMEAAVEHLKDSPESKIQRVAFLAYTTFDRQLLAVACKQNKLKQVGQKATTQDTGQQHTGRSG